MPVKRKTKKSTAKKSTAKKTTKRKTAKKKTAKKKSKKAARKAAFTIAGPSIKQIETRIRENEASLRVAYEKSIRGIEQQLKQFKAEERQLKKELQAIQMQQKPNVALKSKRGRKARQPVKPAVLQTLKHQLNSLQKTQKAAQQQLEDLRMSSKKSQAQVKFLQRFEKEWQKQVAKAKAKAAKKKRRVSARKAEAKTSPKVVMPVQATQPVARPTMPLSEPFVAQLSAVES